MHLDRKDTKNHDNGWAVDIQLYGGDNNVFKTTKKDSKSENRGTSSKLCKIISSSLS